MGDPVLNCILAVCCPPFSSEQHEALARQLIMDGVCGEREAAKVSAWLLKKYDLAEVGTLQPLKESIARLARGEDYKSGQ